MGADITNTSRFNLGGIRVKSQYGYEFFGDDVDTYNRFRPVAGGGVNGSGYTSTSAFFSETTFSKSIFDLIVGLRYDMYGLNGSVNISPAAGLPNPPFVPGRYVLDKDGGSFDPKVTLAAQVTDWLQPYITYSNRCAPSVSELFAGGTHPGAAGVGFAPNLFLNPESQKGIEVGANIKKDGLFTPTDLPVQGRLLSYGRRQLHRLVFDATANWQRNAVLL
jgi:hemoglobin/transferrin/lactoferrin receptor protein